jgi:hypothetical protein
MRYVLALTVTIVLIVSVILLLNFTANNPTGRRYSSETIDLTLSAQGKGQQAEEIVSRDLDVPRNEISRRACLCRTGQPDSQACNSCFANVRQLTQNRRPDFITSDYILEVKNHQGLLYSGRDWDQIGDYAIAATELDIPLWIFVRTDTEVDFQFYDIVELTGGRVVKYLAVPGHIDQVGQVAKVTAACSVIILLLLPLRRREAKPSPEPAKPKSATEDLEDFVRRVKDKKRSEIYKEDSRRL